MPLDPTIVDVLPTTEHIGIGARVQSPEKLPNVMFYLQVCCASKSSKLADSFEAPAGAGEL